MGICCLDAIEMEGRRELGGYSGVQQTRDVEYSGGGVEVAGSSRVAGNGRGWGYGAMVECIYATAVNGSGYTAVWYMTTPGVYK